MRELSISLKKDIIHMASIDYMGIDPASAELVNSKEFRAVLDAHPEFKVVWVGEDEDGDEIFIPVELPFPDDRYEPLAVMNMVTGHEFLWVLNDDECFVDDPSPVAIKFLKVIDDFSVKTEGCRIFIAAPDGLYSDSPEILGAEFDFAKGQYIL